MIEATAGSIESGAVSLRERDTKREFLSEAESQLGELNDWRGLDQIGVATDSGIPSLRFGHSVDLAIQNGTSIEKRRAMAEVLFDYRRIFEGKITHYLPHDGGSLEPLGSIDYENYVIGRTKAADDLSQNQGFYASLFGYPNGNDIDDPTLYFAEAIGATELREFSNIAIYLPASWPETAGYDTYLATIKRWCEIVRPAYGSAGLSILFNEGRQDRQDRLLAFPIARRFPGLDFPETARWYARLGRLRKRGIRTVNWLTIVDDAFVSELGGHTKIAKALDGLGITHSFEGGVIIQAGERPEIGDLNKGIIPPAYRAVAQLLIPIRFMDYDLPLIDAPEPLDPMDETMKWVKRFD